MRQRAMDLFSRRVEAEKMFVHISAVERAGLSSLNEGPIVEYEEVANKGKTAAENLKVQR
jgi:cold shock CspA family protein